jgi:hypothetical protein
MLRASRTRVEAIILGTGIGASGIMALPMRLSAQQPAAVGTLREVRYEAGAIRSSYLPYGQPWVLFGPTAVFRADGGTLLGASDPDRRSLSVKAAARTAQVTFIAGTRSGPAQVSATVSDLSQTIGLSLSPAMPATLQLTADRGSAPADGRTVITLAARLLRTDPSALVSAGTIVTFVATDTLTGQVAPELTGAIPLADPGTGRVTHQITSLVTRTLRIVASSGAVADTAVVAFTP